MRTKKAERVRNFEIIGVDPRPALYLSYDGLSGISERSILHDLLEQLQHLGPERYTEFLEGLRRHHSAYVHIYFHDYVSYGVGGGEATAEFFYGTHLLLYVPPAATGGREALTLVHPAARPERVELEGAAPPPVTA